MTYDQFLVRVAQIPCAGRDRAIGPLLYSLVLATKPDVIVEVGTWMGYTAAWLGRALVDLGRPCTLLCIDDWSLTPTAKDDARRYLEGCGFYAGFEFRSGDSLDPANWPHRLDFAFIDGNHSIDYVTREVMMAADRGASTIVVHDTTSWWGPRDWLEQVRAQTGPDALWDVCELPASDGVTILSRRREKPAVQFSRDDFPRGYIKRVG